MVEEWLGLLRTNPGSERVEDFNQGYPDFKSSTLNHSVTITSFVHIYKAISIKPALSGTFWDDLNTEEVLAELLSFLHIL